MVVFPEKPEGSQKEAKEAPVSGMKTVAPTKLGKHDMVIAFDTTGSMAQYIGAVRDQVASLIPDLFENNEDLRLSIVAFGDYCDMINPFTYGKAYQSIPLTDNENDLIKFVRTSIDTSGGDGPEFYELVIKKIVNETQWREDASHAILLIADAIPHELGYTYRDFVVNNQIDWREEARKAADMCIKIDTVTIQPQPWLKELSAMTNGISVPFETAAKTADLVRAATWSRGSKEARVKFNSFKSSHLDAHSSAIFGAYEKENDEFEDFN